MSLPFSRGKIKVYISSVSLDKEVKLRQQRVLQCLEARKIPHAVADLALSAADKRELRFLMMGKPQPPPQIFNGNDHCGDYAAFCLALEDEILEEFLKLKDHKAKENQETPVNEEVKIDDIKAVDGNKTKDDGEGKEKATKDEGGNQSDRDLREKIVEHKKVLEVSDDKDDDDNDNEDGDDVNDSEDDDDDTTSDEESNDTPSDNSSESETKKGKFPSETTKPLPLARAADEQPTKISPTKTTPPPPSPPPPPPLPPPPPPIASSHPIPIDIKISDLQQLPKSLLEDIRAGKPLKSRGKPANPCGEIAKGIKSGSTPSASKTAATHDARPTFSADELFKGRMSLKSKYDRNPQKTSIRQPNIPDAKKEANGGRFPFADALKGSKIKK